ncbi:MAG: murein biosynthesis integral membrane protein MurJ [bacterium]|nr:murein biosynthesis integral membrane protein MurJ [bacterium]
MPKEQIAKATAIILIGTIIGKIAGFIREILVAKYFGASLITDAYLVAYNIPMILLNMVIAGGVYSATVPTFTKYLANKDYKILWRLFSIIVSYTFIISIVLVLVMVFFAPYLVKFMGYGLKGQTFDLAINLTKVMAPMVIFLGLMSIFMGVLHSFQHFTIPSLNPFILGTTVIIFIVFLSKNIGIFSLGIGLVVGSGLMCLVSLIVLLKKQVKFSFNLNFRYKEVGEFIHLFIPATVGTTILCSYAIISRMMASPLEEGSIAALDFGYMVMQAPLSTFGLAISTAIFPFIANYAATKSYNELVGTMSKGIRMTALIYIPIALIFMVLCEPIIKLLFERGNFDTYDTMMTSKSLYFYSIGMFGLAINFILLRVFYALNDAVIPMLVTAVGVVVHIIFNFILIKYLAHAGIALSASIVHLGTNFILLWFLRQKIGNIGGKQILNSFLKMIVATLPGLLICLGISKYIEMVLDTSRIEVQIIQVGLATTTGLICYLIILWLLKAVELRMIFSLIKDRFRK